MKKEPELLIPFSVKRIKILSLSINELGIEPNISLAMNFEQVTQFNADYNLLFFILTVVSTIENENTKSPALKMEVQNVFEIPNLKDYIKNGTELDLPSNNIFSIVSLSITHARALLAYHTAGTIFQDSLIPVINPVEAAKSFFPTLFKESEVAV